MAISRVLLVDDDEAVREMLSLVLTEEQFEIVTATNVKEALKYIVTEEFDVLVTDLHMPNAGDGFTVASAMRNIHPKAFTLILSGYPDVQEAMAAIRAQADAVLVKPTDVSALRSLIEQKLANPGERGLDGKESVASILERCLDETIKHWFGLVQRDVELTCIPLSVRERTGHLPKLIHDLITRLRLPLSAEATTSKAAQDHGTLRRAQGYTIPMVIEESRILQVSIFNTLNNNLHTVNFSTLLRDVVTIADEVDSQLKQAALRYSEPASVPSAA